VTTGTTCTAPAVDRGGVSFRFEAAGDVTAVRLVQEVVHGVPDPPFVRRDDGAFELRFERAPVDRFEYRFALDHEGGWQELVCDPCNDLRAHGPFGERSVVEFPGYAAPDWLAADAPAGTSRAVMLRSELLGEDQPALVWSAHELGPEDEAPLLVALDGLELDRYSSITHMLDVLTDRGTLPALRAVLIHPTRRTDQYTANPVFAEALATELLPATEKEIGLASPARVGLGASLGAVALLHAHRAGGSRFDALLLQSGSFLAPGQVVGVDEITRVEAFVSEAKRSGAGEPIPVEMTCGLVEEIMADNQEMAGALRDQGFRARLDGRRDAHNWIAWRDAWSPHLETLFGDLGK
jgi:enterochelin esterase-like enzyme